MRRASSSPEMISIVQLVVERTHSRNVREWRASPNAAVATTFTESVPHSCTARLKRRNTRTVSDIDSGESSPPLKTASPNRVTSRSSWTSFSRPAWRREIFKRTEFEPMSMAAKVGIEGRSKVNHQYSHTRVDSRKLVRFPVVGQVETGLCNRPGRQREFTPRQSRFRQMEARPTRCLLLGTPTPLPPCLMESWAWREFSALVFEN